MSQRARATKERAQQRQVWWAALSAVAVLLLVVLAVVMLAAGGDDDGTDGASAGGVVRVSMTEFAFDPDPIVLEVGDARIDVVNDGQVAHDLVVGELGKGTPDLPPGEHLELDLSEAPAGTYRVVCDLPGHTEAGMVTELTLR